MQHLRTGDLLRTLTHQVTRSGMLTKKWSSLEWKSDELMEVRTGRLDNEQPPGFVRTVHGQIYC